MKRSHRFGTGPYDSRRHGGFTLQELAIYVVLLAILGTPVVTMVLVSTRHISEIDATGKIRERNRVTLFRIDSELREAIATTLSVSNSGRTLTFSLANGFDGTAVVVGDSIEYSFELATGESANGLDDNGNGLADEGVLVRRNLTALEEAAVCGGVDISASGFAVSGIAVTVNLTSVAIAQRANSDFTVAGSVAVYPYN